MRNVLIILCCYTHALFGQSGLRSVNMYTTQNGLSNNTIYCIRQDSRGFLWCGTQEGLNRFDGHRFKKFFAEKDPDAGLANNTVMDILEYQNGQLLIATSNGLSVLNTLSYNFENKKISHPDLESGSGTLVNSLYKDKDGNIWVNHSGELDLLDSNLHYMYRFTDLPWAKDLKGIKIQWENWFSDKQNRLWLPSDTSGIQIIDFSQKKIWNSRNNPQQYDFLKPKYIRSAFLDESANTVWYAPWGSGLYRYDLNTNSQVQQNPGFTGTEEHQSVNAILKINAEKILYSNAQRCFIVDAATLKYEEVPIEYKDLPGRNMDISTIILFKSINDNYWVGSFNGLFQLENQEGISKRINLGDVEKNGTMGECTGIARSSSGNFFIGCLNNKLFEGEKDLSSFKSYSIAGNRDIRLHCIQEDKSGRLWVGSSNGFYQFHSSTKAFTQPRWLHPDLNSAIINYIYCDREGNTWIATRDPFGLYRYLPASGKCEKIKNSITDYFQSVGQSSRISYITEDEKKQLWMVSRLGGGIICYNQAGNNWSVYPNKKENRNLLLKPMGRVHADNASNLWLYDQFGTGLIKYNYAGDTVNLITRNDGLPSDFIRSICHDGSGGLWILTEYGISRFDMAKQKIVFNTFFKSTPLSPYAYLIFDSLSKSIICVNKDQLLFYPAAGFQSEKKQRLQPLIDKVWVNSKEVLKDVNGQLLKLKPGETNVSIDFTVVHYSNADKIKFAYQLSGADNDWKYAEASRSAQYAVLTPGHYVFRLKVADENGNWTEPFNTFSFTIVPYFWQTGLFKVALVLVIAGIAFYFFRRRIKSIRHEAALKQQIAETEMMALRAQMNPHFIFNCINSIDAMIQSNDKYQATVYLNKFAKLIRNILDSSKQNLVPLSKDLETLQLYIDLEMFRNENKFKAEIHADPQLLQDDYQVPPLIVQPYVENAILHGLRHRDDNNGKLTVNIQKQNGHLNYEITDNGVGRNKKQTSFSELKKANGYGMQISEDRVRIFNKEEKASVQITDLQQNDQPTGTRVTVQLKIQ